MNLFTFAYTLSVRCNGDRKYMVRYLPHWHAIAVEVTEMIFRAILHDPALYPDPDDFKPERFLNPDGSLGDDPILGSAFGYGRRICPGRYFVDATLFIVVASLFSVFNVEKGRDSENDPPSYTFSGGGVIR